MAYSSCAFDQFKELPSGDMFHHDVYIIVRLEHFVTKESKGLSKDS